MASSNFPLLLCKWILSPLWFDIPKLLKLSKVVTVCYDLLQVVFGTMTINSTSILYLPNSTLPVLITF